MSDKDKFDILMLVFLSPLLMTIILFVIDPIIRYLRKL